MKKIAIVSTVLSVLSFGAMAEKPSFNFVEGGYTSSFESSNFDGFELKGNFELNQNFYLSSEYRNYNDEDEGVTIDLNGYQFGVGYKFDISSSSVFFTQLDYVKVKAKIDFEGFDLSASENGYQLGAGVRSMVTNNLELSAAVNYLDVEESDTFANLGVAYHFNDAFGMYFDVDTDFDDSEYSVGIRFSF